MSPAVTGTNHGRLGEDEALVFKPVHVFLDGVVAHADGTSDAAVARMALVRLSVLAVHQEGKDGDLSRIKSKPKHSLGHRKEIAGGVTFVLIMVQ